MTLLLPAAFSFGLATGLRSMSGVTAIAWATHLGWLNLSSTPLAFGAMPAVRWTLTVCAFGEWIADKLPFIPSRKKPLPMLARLINGAACGAALSLGTPPSTTGEVALCIATGLAGALFGTFGGYESRVGAVKAIGGRDWPIALFEDGITVALLLVSLHNLNAPLEVYF